MNRYPAAPRFGLIVVLTIACMGLGGCFDLVQNVGISRDGTGHYQTSVSAQGIVGEALKNEKIVDTTHNRAEMTTTAVNGKVTRTADIAFRSLSDLALSNETMSLTVKGRDFFGLGPAHVAYRCTFLVDKAKNSHASGDDRMNGGNGIGAQIAQSILGDHTYSFSITVPGSVERVAPVVVGDQIYRPEVSGDFYHGHTVTWRLPLAALIDTKALDFEVDFSAYGLFSDSKSKLVASE